MLTVVSMMGHGVATVWVDEEQNIWKLDFINLPTVRAHVCASEYEWIIEHVLVH